MGTMTRCRIYLTMGMAVEARYSRSLLKGAINTRLTHRPLVIYTQPVVTFASLITIDKSLEEHTPLLYSPISSSISKFRGKNFYLHRFYTNIDPLLRIFRIAVHIMFIQFFEELLFDASRIKSRIKSKIKIVINYSFGSRSYGRSIKRSQKNGWVYRLTAGCSYTYRKIACVFIRA